MAGKVAGKRSRRGQRISFLETHGQQKNSSNIRLHTEVQARKTHPIVVKRDLPGSTVACESALRSAGTLLSRVRAPLPASWPDGGPESLRSSCCGLAIYKKLNLPKWRSHPKYALWQWFWWWLLQRSLLIKQYKSAWIVLTRGAAALGK
ncbi:hypothetical protein PoB_004027900 [Plakobranchus ocellatus]|uniref:Uncharacterized protein n=1 Tax=Plakobranchus ocellatus TaxID=259542 RepID=A0AAV4B186_9GAST|nr:hypothetical protein PoB_004027900 [Plakobranchus ocellatus]